MMTQVTRPAEPSHLARALVVVVVHLGLAAAVFARLTYDEAAPKAHVRDGSSVALEALEWRHVPPARPLLAHVRGMTGDAVALPSTVARATAPAAPFGFSHATIVPQCSTGNNPKPERDFVYVKRVHEARLSRDVRGEGGSE